MQVFTRALGTLLLAAPTVGCSAATSAPAQASSSLVAAPFAERCVGAGMHPGLARVDAADTLALEALRGQVVVLEFMASWCEPCLEGLPHLAALHRAHSRDGLAVVWVSQDFDRADIDSLYRARAGQIPFPVVHDEGEAWWRATGLSSVPGLVVIDRAGCVRMVEAAEGDAWRRADALVERLLAGPGT